jgi:hypothetical protein
VALAPLRVSNRPAATTWLPAPVTTRAITSLLVAVLPSRLPAVEPGPGTGAQGSRPPSEARTAASWLRLTPPRAEKLPPRKTVSFVAASARTWELTVGAKDGTSAPVAVSYAATRLRI